MQRISYKSREVFIPLPYEVINESSKVNGYEKFTAMTDLGHKIYKKFQEANLSPLFTTRDRLGQEVRNEHGNLIFTGIIINLLDIVE